MLCCSSPAESSPYPALQVTPRDTLSRPSTPPTRWLTPLSPTHTILRGATLLQVASTFCASYVDANVTFRNLRWHDSRSGADLCARQGGPSPVYADGSASGWKASDLHTDELGCKKP